MAICDFSPNFAVTRAINTYVTSVTMELKDRIATIIKVNNHTASSFADLLGIQRSSVSHILNGRNNPSLDFIQKVLDNFPRVDSGWLITGKNPESKTKIELPGENKTTQEMGSLSPKKKLKKASGIKTIEKIVIFYTDRTFETYEED